MKRLVPMLMLLAAVFIISTFVAFLSSIWTGDGRWASTGMATMCMSIVCGGIAAASAP